MKCYLWVPRSDQAEIRIMRSFFRGDFNRAIRSIGTVFIKFLGNYPQVLQPTDKMVLPRSGDKEGREEEIKLVRKNLLDWYSVNKRTLPWRTIASSPNSMDDDVRGYSVWVSEIMLQQTRVETVIDYYLRWMK